MPSTTATNARPWDSPAVVHRNTRPIFPRRVFTTDFCAVCCAQRHKMHTDQDHMDSRSGLTLSVGRARRAGGRPNRRSHYCADLVVFPTWASFFFVGGGVGGWVRSLSSNIVGVIVAS